jgi:hypothetical protein
MELTTKDYRATYDGVYVADIGFKKQLWTIDPELDVVWDWGSKKWEIWKFPGQPKKLKKKMDTQAHHVMTIQTQNRSFRELGADVLLRLQQINPERVGYKELFDYFDKMDDNLKRAKAKALEEKIGSISKEVDWLFRGHRSQVPKNYIINVPKSQKVLGVLANGR